MIRLYHLFIGFLLCINCVSGQYSEELSSTPRDYFDEKLYVHSITEGITSNGDLWKEEKAQSEIEWTQLLTEYPYTNIQESLLDIDDKSVTIDLINKHIVNRNYSEAFELLNQINPSDLSNDLQADYQFIRGYLLFVHKDFLQAQKIFDNVRSLQSKFSDQSLYYSAFCDLFGGEYLSSSEKFESLSDNKKFRHNIPYYLSILYYKQERFDELIDYANGTLQQLSISNEPEIRELLRRAHYKNGNWDKLSELILADGLCCATNEEHYLAGMTLYKQGKHLQAAKHLKIATELSSKEGQNALLAQATIENNPDTKEILLQKAALLTYDLNIRDQALLHLARLKAQQGSSDDALSYTRRITEHSIYFDDALREEISILYENKDYKRALKVLLRIKSQDENYMTMYHELILLNGLAELKSGEQEQAKTFLTEASKLPYFPLAQKQANYWLAHISFMDRNYNKALEYLAQYDQQNMLKTLPKESSILQAQYLKAYAYLKLNKYEKALTAFDNAEQLVLASYRSKDEDKYAIQYEDILLRQADCSLALGRKAKAEDYYEKAYKNQIAHGDYALYQKGKIEDLSRESFLQISTYELLAKEYPNSKYVPDAQMKTGIALLKMGKSKEAYDVFAQVYRSPISREGDKFKSLMNMGLIHYNQGDIESALTYYKKIFEEAHLAQEQGNEALKVIEEIYLVNLKDSEGYYDFLNSIGAASLTHEEKDSIDFHLALSVAKDEVKDGIRQLEHYLRKYPKARYATQSIKELAKLYEKTEQIDLAISSYRRLSDTDNATSDMAMHQIIRLFHKSNDLGMDYLNTNKEIIEQDFSPSSTNEAYVRIAKAAVFNDKTIDYEKEILKALELGEMSMDEEEKIKLALVEEYVAGRNYTKANGLLKELSQSQNEEIAARSLYLVANRLYDLEKLDQSAIVIENILKKDKINREIVARSLLLRSRIYLRLQEYDLAEAALLPVLQQKDLDSNILLEGELLLKNISKDKTEYQQNESPTLELQYQEDEE